MLNRLREGNHTNKDIMQLKERPIILPSSANYPKDAAHLFVRNSKVNDFNNEAHNALPGTKYSIMAQDNVIGVQSQEL